MKKVHFLFALVALMFVTTALAPKMGMKAPKPSEDLEWYTYVKDAMAESEETGKPIMANFTGSDWCGWCIRLHNEVFGTEDFKQWADDNVVLLELDYPKRTVLPDDLKQQNAGMQQAFGITGYPTIWFFNMSEKDDGTFDIKPINKTGYVAGGAATWTGHADKLLANPLK